ncbi:exonuclease domain-containing protein [Albidovulum sediminis]|uniref:Exonuclease domain-containing protein n=1 Tax=Albidovulum sediminis TaxID=3066345 RepID=A0ABT2NW77_9RHOB|nr:exonuclease domain-containing protein [Defluviimonas sediminis]MCT8331864.1 exonuclease domain-containing protein [Defluviimonas sediminis]
MALVLFDTETTGLSRHFDQIIEFGAVRVNDDLEVEEHFETACRLQPHIVPTPSALHVTGRSYAELTSPLRRSHFEMISEIHRRFTGWSPAAFIGYNSIRFDEEFLRHAFYQCLLEPYVTSIGNARGDVLKLVRAVSKLRPDVLPAAYGADGQRSMKLHDVAIACGFKSNGAHEAMADVEAMLWVVKVIANGAPEIWSSFMRFSTKAAAQEFLQEEDVFVSFEAETAGQGFRLLTAFGQHPVQSARRYCLDLTFSVDAIRGASDCELVEMFKQREGPLRRVKTNASPLLFPMYEVLESTFPGTVEEDVLNLARSVHSDESLVRRLNTAALAAEPVYGVSPHVEQQLYDRFIPDIDKALMQQFHAVPWALRNEVVARISDDRLRRLGQRAIYFEMPHLLPDKSRTMLDKAVRDRWTGDATAPWTTASSALLDLDAISDRLAHPNLVEFAEVLAQWT